MLPVLPRTLKDTDRLAYLAMQFRSTRDEADRQAVAQDYAETVDRLIQSGCWHESPTPEEQLPDGWMPKAFFDFWTQPQSSQEVVLEKKPTQSRSDEFLASFQMQAMCSSLRSLVAVGADPGPEARAFLKSLRDAFVSRCSGRAIDRIPEVEDDTSGPALLVIAEILFFTNLAFLTPEEVEEQRRIGFHRGSNGLP
jgi:hypothetical protein